MAAHRYTLRLHRGLRVLAEVQTNIDPSDKAALRAKLEELVKATAGTLQLDLSLWRLRVHRHGGGMVIATVAVDRSGRTVVRR